MANLTLFGCSDSSDNKAEKISDSKVLERCIDDMNELTLEFDFKKEYKVVPSISCDKAEEDARSFVPEEAFAVSHHGMPQAVFVGRRFNIIPSMQSSYSH